MRASEPIPPSGGLAAELPALGSVTSVYIYLADIDGGERIETTLTRGCYPDPDSPDDLLSEGIDSKSDVCWYSSTDFRHPRTTSPVRRQS